MPARCLGRRGPSAPRRRPRPPPRRARPVRRRPVAGHAAQAAAGVFAGPISPSALEQYLSCPFAFYLRYVLGLEVPDDPEESLSIEPVDLGSLAHEILQGAYAAAAVGVPSAVGVLAALDDVAAAAFARAEARGLTGFPLSWHVLADALLADCDMSSRPTHAGETISFRPSLSGGRPPKLQCRGCSPTTALRLLCSNCWWASASWFPRSYRSHRP